MSEPVSGRTRDSAHDPVRGSGALPTDGPLGRVVVAFDNEIARAVIAIAKATGFDTLLLDGAAGGSCPDPAGWVADHPLAESDHLVVCNHDADGAYDLLRTGVGGKAAYVAMMASRKRSAEVLSDFSQAFDETALRRLHLPAGLNVGGRSPGEIALSVVAEIVADRHGRPGTPMRDQGS